MAPASAFSEILKRYRVRARLTQEELAERSGTSVRTISDLERGIKQTPRGATIELLAGALGLSEHDLAAFEAAARGTEVLIGGPNPPLPARPPRLPVQLTPFIGREREVQTVREMLERPEVRLLTLTGSGGSGKTRLALAAVEGMIENFPDGIAFVDLGVIIRPELVDLGIARALGINEVADGSLLDGLREYLREKQLLIVMDNFELATGSRCSREGRRISQPGSKR